MLKVKNVSKSFGQLKALNTINFEIEQGQVLGLVGQNGAGKSTLLRIIMQFIKSSSGEVYYDNRLVTSTLYNKIGFLPEERSLFLNYSIQRQLLYFAKLHGISKKEANQSIEKYLKDFDVKGALKTKINQLSKGNQQKVQIIASLLHNPELIILDEPFSGLDPVNAEIFLANIKKLKDSGKTIIFSSHNMSNVEKLCDKVVMLKNGQMVLNSDINSIKKEYGRVNLRLYSTRIPEFFEKFEGVTILSYDANNHLYDLKLDAPEVGKLIYDSLKIDGYSPVFNQDYPSLSEIFKRKVQEDE